MQKIASFTINHDILLPGLYISRVDGDVVTYDLRMRVPNRGDYLSTGAAHTIEHLLATYVRNSACSPQVVYVGPMGCRTGFYFLTRDKLTKGEVLALLRDTFAFIAAYEGEVPGTKQAECGNYLDHDLFMAKKEAAAYKQVLDRLTEDSFTYPG
jgi:S-ribosylhomocysteine lyase